MKLVRTLFAAHLAALPSAAPAADWSYPNQCCPISCAPIDATERLEGEPVSAPRAVFTARHGRLPVPAGLPLRQSPDGRIHICVGFDPFGDPEVKCLFVPLIT